MPLSCYSDGGMRRGKLSGAVAVTSVTDMEVKGSAKAAGLLIDADSSGLENTIFLGKVDAMACLKPFRLFLFERLAIMNVG